MNHEQLVQLLTLGVRRGASDIHFEAGYPPSYRIFGDLVTARLEPLTTEDTESIARLVIGAESAFFRGEAHDADHGFSVTGLSRFRVNLLRQRGSIGVVMRVIPFEIPSFEQLNLPAAVASLAHVRSGLVLVVGAAGNGKSTTIASLLEAVNESRRSHIVTIEDPIEFLFPAKKSLVIQREVGTDTGSFGTALRSVIRQDPDVIMVGEIRDRETAEICLRAAETGHLVISSLHTQDVPRSISRFVGLFPSDEQQGVRGRLAETLKAMVALRLLLRADGTGLLPAAEVMLSTRSIQTQIREGASMESLLRLIESGRVDLGMQSFDQHLVELVQTGRISADLARAHATHPSDVARALLLDEGGGSGDLNF
ncbi:type IV pilus twitching motility protein PilT [Vulgatibacter sp.]|uniref:type IV pilus twitching motility protein PilT n=1 Tax=Vulgatibacter sp. TaxID=1971226 RepID=UPI003567C83D